MAARPVNSGRLVNSGEGRIAVETYDGRDIFSVLLFDGGTELYPLWGRIGKPSIYSVEV